MKPVFCYLFFFLLLFNNTIAQDFEIKYKEGLVQKFNQDFHYTYMGMNEHELFYLVEGDVRNVKQVAVFSKDSLGSYVVDMQKPGKNYSGADFKSVEYYDGKLLFFYFAMNKSSRKYELLAVRYSLRDNAIQDIKPLIVGDAYFKNKIENISIMDSIWLSGRYFYYDIEESDISCFNAIITFKKGIRLNYRYDNEFNLQAIDTIKLNKGVFRPFNRDGQELVYWDPESSSTIFRHDSIVHGELISRIFDISILNGKTELKIRKSIDGYASDFIYMPKDNVYNFVYLSFGQHLEKYTINSLSIDYNGNIVDEKEVSVPYTKDELNRLFKSTGKYTVKNIETYFVDSLKNFHLFIYSDRAKYGPTYSSSELTDFTYVILDSTFKIKSYYLSPEDKMYNYVFNMSHQGAVAGPGGGMVAYGGYYSNFQEVNRPFLFLFKEQYFMINPYYKSTSLRNGDIILSVLQLSEEFKQFDLASYNYRTEYAVGLYDTKKVGFSIDPNLILDYKEDGNSLVIYSLSFFHNQPVLRSITISQKH